MMATTENIHEALRYMANSSRLEFLGRVEAPISTEVVRLADRAGVVFDGIYISQRKLLDAQHSMWEFKSLLTEIDSLIYPDWKQWLWIDAVRDK